MQPGSIRQKMIYIYIINKQKGNHVKVKKQNQKKSKKNQKKIKKKKAKKKSKKQKTHTCSFSSKCN